MKKEENLLSKFYYPCCNRNQCKGLLRIYFNDNFTINFECENNKNHKREKIYFETFEKFFLKEKEFDYCSKCDTNLECDNKYICKECNNIYCNSCFIYDEHIKTNMNNLNIKNNKCTLHQGNLIYYCETCKKYACIDCLKKNTDGIHENHKFINMSETMPTINEIKKLKNKINEKEKTYEDLIQSLDRWSKKILEKVEKLKQQLKKEIELLKKLFYNFNQNFANLAYYDNFYNTINYIKNINNESLNKFQVCDNFEQKTKNLFNFFFPNKNEINNKNASLSFYDDIEDGIISKITDNLFFVSSKNKVRIYEYNIYEDKIDYNANLDFFKKINSISSSINNDSVYIYACLAKKKKVKIFIYNLKKQLLQLSDIVIKDDNQDSFSENYFDKCIQLSNHLIAISDNKELSIWENKDDIKKYTKINQCIIEDDYFILDMILIENEIFVCLFYNINTKNSEIIYYNYNYNYNNLVHEKKLTHIECFQGKLSCLYLFKQYLLIKGYKGIYILSNRTK